MNVPTRSTDDAEFHDRIRIAGLWIGRDFNILIKRYVIDYGKLGHRMFVKPKKGDPRGIRAPPVRAKVAPAIELFLIDPIHPAIQNLLVAVTRQRALPPLHA